MKTVGNIALFTILAAAGAYGYTWFKRQKQLLSKMCIDVTNFSIQDLNIYHSKATITLTIQNTSDLNLTLRRQSYDVMFNGKFVANVSKAAAVQLPRKQKVTVQLNVDFALKEVIKVALSSIKDWKKDINIQIKGKINAGTGLFFVNIPINFTSTVADIMNPTKDTSECY